MTYEHQICDQELGLYYFSILKSNESLVVEYLQGVWLDYSKQTLLTQGNYVRAQG